MHFYPSLTLDGIDQLTENAFNSLYKSITIIEAQKCLIDLKIASYTKMKQKDRERFHRNIHDQAFPEQEKKGLTAEQVRNKLNQIL